MDVFSLRDRVISEYRSYSEGFVEIADERIRSAVDDAFDRGLLWPDPRIGLNPSFEPGATVEELVGSGRLHPLAEEIFRKDKSDEDPQGQPMTLHRHQVQAIDAAADNRSYVLTTGTGSGKSLAYIVPIVDHVLRAGSGRGIKALVLYPMNALANSQYEELGKFLDHGPWTAENHGVHSPEVPTGQRPVSFAVFTGQQNEAERRAIRDNPPDVLLTNYVMAELILTRYNDIKLVNAMASLRFLVLDELHTYRGRQGADVAMLVRRIREACGATELQCVGTSATLSTEGSHAERSIQVATVASRLFGTEVRPSEVISETLRRTTPEPSDRPDFTEALIRSVTGDTPEPTSYDAMRRDPFSSWIESSFGLETRDGRLVRAPQSRSRATSAGPRCCPLKPVSRGRTAGTPSGAGCWPAPGSEARRTATPCSPSGSTSSSAPAAPLTPPRRRLMTEASRCGLSASFAMSPTESTCPWRSAAPADRSTTSCSARPRDQRPGRSARSPRPGGTHRIRCSAGLPVHCPRAGRPVG